MKFKTLLDLRYIYGTTIFGKIDFAFCCDSKIIDYRDVNFHQILTVAMICRNFRTLLNIFELFINIRYFLIFSNFYL